MNYLNLFESNNPESTNKFQEKLLLPKNIQIASVNVLKTEPKSLGNLNYLDRNQTMSSKAFKNSCSFSCKNLRYINELTQKIYELLSDNEHLTKVNEYMMFHLEKKEQMYMKVSNEITKLKKNLHNRKKSENSNVDKQSQIKISSQTLPKFMSSSNELTNQKNQIRLSFTVSNLKDLIREEKPFEVKPVHTLSDTEDQVKRIPIANQFTEKRPRISSPNNKVASCILPSHSRNVLKKQHRDSNSNLPEHVMGLVTNKLNHYEKITELTSRDFKRKYKDNKRISLLKLEDDNLAHMIRDNVQTQLYELTLSDDLFLEKMRGESDDKLLSYSDSIGNLIIEYRNSLKLIKKIKLFLKGSVNLGNSLLIDDFSTSLITNACSILNCERTTLFVLDKVSDELVVHSGNGLKKSQVRVGKEKGIVGLCLQIGKKIKVDDAYSDVRFNQDVDKLTGFRTKTILCMPLKDENGDIFGVIQSINKKEGKFDEDDEELMEIFSSQASVILKNTMNYDENYLYACRLRMILDFNFEIEKMDSFGDFTMNAEHFIMKLFNSNYAVFLVYDEEIDRLLHYNKLKCEEKKNVGIIYYVLKSKEFYGCNPIDCNYYNNLADIGAGFSLVTFPILDSSYKSVLAVVQMRYNYELVGIPERPKAMAMIIFELYVKICMSWMERQFKINFSENN